MFTKVNIFLYKTITVVYYIIYIFIAYICSSKVGVIRDFGVTNLKKFNNALEPIETTKRSRKRKSATKVNSVTKKKRATRKTTIIEKIPDVKDVESSNEVSSSEVSVVDAFTQPDAYQVLEPVAENVQDEAEDFSKSVDVSSPLFTGNISGSQGEAGLPEKPGPR